MTRLLSAASRSILAVALFLFVLAVLRWGPVYADPPWDVRALPLGGAAVVLATLAALAGAERRPLRVRPLALGLAAAAAALAAIVVLRGPGGLAAEARDPRGGRFRLAPGPIDLVGDDLARLPRSRWWTVEWAGPLRVPASGASRLWADASGALTVSVDGRDVLRAEGSPVRAGADAVLGPGAHSLRVRLESAGSGPRLRLGWTRGLSRRDEMIPPRDLGPQTTPLLWAATDLLALVVAALAAALSWVLPWDRPRRPSPREVTLGEVWVSLAGHAALAALMSWPLVLDLAGSGPMGKSDGRLNAWILAWDVHALIREPARLFQAPIFHPLPDALAFSENLLVPAVLASPAILFGNPVLAYNVALLLSCVVSGLGAQLLVRRASGDRLAAFVAGATFGVGAHRWFRMAHLHAEVTLFLPFALLAFDRFWERRTLRRGLLVGVLMALQALSSVYLGAITATALGIGVTAAIFAGLRGKALARVGAGALLAALLVAPVAYPYLRMRAFQGMEFTLADEANFATTLESYGASATRLYGPLTARHADPLRARDPLFPGLVALVLGLAGLASAPRRYRAVAVAASAVAILISLGPESAFYRFLHEQVVFFRGIRALARFSLLPVLALAVLSGFALAGRWRASLVALVLLLAEASQVPLRYAPYRAPGAAARWLAGREGAVAYLPLGHERDTDAMLQSTVHFRPLLNGDSGFVPRSYDRELELLDGPLGAEGLRLLRGLGVVHVVTHDDRELPLLARFGDERVWGVPPGDAASAVVAGRAVAALWGRGGAELDLGEPAGVGRIAFELSNAPWVERPRVAVSADGAHWEELDGTASLADAVLSLTRDPRHAQGELRLTAPAARYLRLDPRLPARPGIVWVAP